MPSNKRDSYINESWFSAQKIIRQSGFDVYSDDGWLTIEGFEKLADYLQKNNAISKLELIDWITPIDHKDRTGLKCHLNRIKKLNKLDSLK